MPKPAAFRLIVHWLLVEIISYSFVDAELLNVVIGQVICAPTISMASCNASIGPVNVTGRAKIGHVCT